MTRHRNALTDTENTPFSGSDSGYSQGSIVILSSTPSLNGSTGGYSSGRLSNGSPYDNSSPNESTDALNRDQSQEDFLNDLFTNEKEINDDDNNESGKNFDLSGIFKNWSRFGMGLVRRSLPGKGCRDDHC